MVVHIGVVMIAVAFAASHSYGHNRQFRLMPGQSARVSAHTVTYLGTTTVRHANKTSLTARVRIDGGKVYAPALHQFPFATQAIGAPSVRTGFVDDVYLTLVGAPEGAGQAAVIGVIVQPLIAWLWVGGGLMALGTLLAAWPSERRSKATPPPVLEEVRVGPDDDPVPEPVVLSR